jgi:hypothetical protein
MARKKKSTYTPCAIIFGARLREHMRRVCETEGCTMEELAHELVGSSSPNTSWSTVRHYFTGASSPRWERIDTISQRLGVAVAELFTEVGA